MKKAFIIIGGVALFFLTSIGGLYLLGYHIYNNVSCNTFNIDNIELRTGLNIPEVTQTDCVCDENSKLSQFTIDSEQVNLHDYIAQNNFVRQNDHYTASGSNPDTRWNANLDTANYQLSVMIEYKISSKERRE
jgi:hypothetical protein